jgi:hypothetical protein
VDVVAGYLQLGLSFDRLERGFVDAWTGPAALRAQVESGPLPRAADLQRRAQELRRELPSAGLAPQRERWLDGQLAALACSARVLDGQPVAYLDQVQTWFEVRPELGDEATYADAHAELDRLLPGSGPLLERYTAYRDGQSVPPDRLAEAVREVSTLLRRGRGRRSPCRRTRSSSTRSSPTGRGRASTPTSAASAARWPSTPTCRWASARCPRWSPTSPTPGHHTERCRKQVSQRTLPEYDLWLVNTPRTCWPRGWPTSGWPASTCSTGGPVVGALYADLGIAYDGELGQRIARAAAPLGAVRQDAALLLHDRGASVEQVEAHLAAGRCSRRTAPARPSPSSPTRCGGPTSAPTSRASGCCPVAGRPPRGHAGRLLASPGCWTSS